MPLQVLYDPDCGICTWTARVLRALDRRRGGLEVIGFDEARARNIASELDDRRLYASFHSVDAGIVRSGAHAIPSVLDRLPLGRGPARVIRRSRFAMAVVTRAYGWIAAHRGVTGCPPDLDPAGASSVPAALRPR